MAHICTNDKLQIKDMFQMVASWLQFSTKGYLMFGPWRNYWMNASLCKGKDIFELTYLEFCWLLVVVEAPGLFGWCSGSTFPRPGSIPEPWNKSRNMKWTKNWLIKIHEIDESCLRANLPNSFRQKTQIELDPPFSFLVIRYLVLLDETLANL